MMAQKIKGRDRWNGATFETTQQINSIPRRPSIQLRGIIGFERLRGKWINANPEHSELELLTACVGFARACGLVLREKLLAASIRELGGDHDQLA